MAIDWRGSAVRTDIVAQEMFGTNMLFDRDGVGPDGTFDDSMRALNIEDVRYPGGSIAEWYFDINNPDATLVWAQDREEWRDVMPLSEFLTWAGSEDVGVTLVIPTGALMGDGPVGDRGPLASAEADIYRYVTDVLGGVYGSARIDAFELGNEYWLAAELNHVEYSRIANLMAETAQRAIDDHRAREGLGETWSEPNIAIQIGQYGQFSTTQGWVQNELLIDWLSPGAADAVDAVVAHYYTRGSFDDLENYGYYFDRLDAWAADTRLTDIEYLVSEWNVNNNLSEELGLKHVSTLWHMFADMMLREVDAAHIWPIQQNTRTDLSGDEGQTDLTLAGEAYRLLSEAVVGTELTHVTEWDGGAAWVYAGATETHVFLASRSETVSRFALDRTDLGLAGQLWWSATLGSSEEPGDWTADPVLEVWADTDPDLDVLTFDLEPFEAVRVTFYDDPLPSSPGSSFPQPIVGGAGDDLIVASDIDTFIESGGGDDTLRGGDGADSLDGGSGSDWLAGGRGSDNLFARGGDDTLQGGAGDLLDGGAGNDVYVFSLSEAQAGLLEVEVAPSAPAGFVVPSEIVAWSWSQCAAPDYTYWI